MVDRFTIQTNLTRGVVVYTMIVLSMIIYYLINRHTGVFITLILVIGVFFNYILSKQLFLIVADKQKVTFEYLQLYKKISICERKLVCVKKRVEMTFRGGKNEIFEIHNKESGKKIVEVSKRQFKSESDYKLFIDLFEIKKN